MAKVPARQFLPRPVQSPLDPVELAASAYAAAINDAARLLHLTGSPLARQVASALFRVRDSIAPLPEAEGSGDSRTEAHRLARIPPLHCEPVDCGPLIGALVLPVMPSAAGFLRPMRRFYCETLRIAREAANPVDALMALNALRVEFAWHADFYCWRRMAVSAGACAAVEVTLLKISSALAAAAKATATENFQ